jgi:hypothetical protein
MREREIETLKERNEAKKQRKRKKEDVRSTMKEKDIVRKENEREGETETLTK